MGAILHDGVVEGFLVAFSLALGQGLIPLGLALLAEDPSAVIFALKHEQTLPGDQEHIDFRGAVFALWDVNVEKELATVFFIGPQVAVGHVFA